MIGILFVWCDVCVIYIKETTQAEIKHDEFMSLFICVIQTCVIIVIFSMSYGSVRPCFQIDCNPLVEGEGSSGS